MKRFYIILLLVFVSALQTLKAQDPISVFLGLQPGFTKERSYLQGEFDLNVVPLVVEIPFSLRADFRLCTLGTYHFGGVKNGFADLGANILIPVYLKKKNSKSDYSEGFYIASLSGFSKNQLKNYYTLILGIEPGYMFHTNKHFTLSLGMQLGGSLFMFPDANSVLQDHLGFKANLGFWI